MQSLLDTDLYKLTLQQAVQRCFPRAQVVYRLHESRGARFPREFAQWLTEEVASWRDALVCTVEELDWLAGTGYFSSTYLESLAAHRFERHHFHASVDENGHLAVCVAGPWQTTVLWEAPLLATISELYFDRVAPDWKKPAVEEEYALYVRRKAHHLLANSCSFGEFSTRRRRSAQLQETALRACIQAVREAGDTNGAGFLGTSNVHFARKLGIPVIGTMAHEWVMAHSVFSGLETANRDALLRWMQIYGQRGSTALTDTYTSALFFENFDRVLAEAFPALGHDSGDPFLFIQNALTFYDLRGIDAREKTLLFSERVAADAAIAIRQLTDRQTRVAFSLPAGMHDDDHPALDLDLKLAEVNGKPVVKLTDDPDSASGPSDLVTAVARCVARRTRGSPHLTSS